MTDEPTTPTQDEELSAPEQPEQEAPAESKSQQRRKAALADDASPVLGDKTEDPLEHGKATALRNA